jgi:glucokinase
VATLAAPEQAIGLDVGGTKVAAMRVAADGSIQDQALVHTPMVDAEELLSSAAKLARSLMTDQVRAIGVGATGLIDFAAGSLRYSPNLPYRDVPIRDRVTEETGLPCLVDNDANVAAWAEFKVGAGRGTTDMLMVTVGTGIGGGIVSGGRMFRGAHGFGAEIGHVIVEPNGPPCGCGNLGCWEQVACGRAIDRLGRDQAAASPSSLMVRLAGGDPAAVTGPIVVQAAHEGDPPAMAVLAEVGKRLGEGMAGMANILDPQIVVVGGGAISAGDLLLEPARAAFTRAIMAPEYRPQVPIVPAQMGNAAGAIGAALLALDELIAPRAQE